MYVLHVTGQGGGGGGLLHAVLQSLKIVFTFCAKMSLKKRSPHLFSRKQTLVFHSSQQLFTDGYNLEVSYYLLYIIQTTVLA